MTVNVFDGQWESVGMSQEELIEMYPDTLEQTEVRNPFPTGVEDVTHWSDQYRIHQLLKLLKKQP